MPSSNDLCSGPPHPEETVSKMPKITHLLSQWFTHEKKLTTVRVYALTWRLSWCLRLHLSRLVMKQMGPESRLPLLGINTLINIQSPLCLFARCVCETQFQMVFIGRVSWYHAVLGVCVCLTCFSCRPWPQVLSSRSHRPWMSVFSCRPVMLASPCPSSTLSFPILSISIRLV